MYHEKHGWKTFYNIYMKETNKNPETWITHQSLISKGGPNNMEIVMKCELPIYKTVEKRGKFGINNFYAILLMDYCSIILF